MNPTEQAIKELKSKVLALLGDPLSDRQFVDWLATYAARGQKILNPPQLGFKDESQRRSVLSDIGQFHSSQAVVDWAHSKHLTLPHNQNWWWCNPDNRTGRILGFDGNPEHPDQSFGIPRITNGIDVWIERMDGTLFKGHRDWLKLDRLQSGNGTSKRCECAGQDKACTLCNGTGILLKSSVQKLNQTGSLASIDPQHLRVAKQFLSTEGALTRFAVKYQAVVGAVLDATTEEAVARAYGVYIDKKLQEEVLT